MPRDAVSRTAIVERTVRHKWVNGYDVPIHFSSIKFCKNIVFCILDNIIVMKTLSKTTSLFFNSVSKSSP